MQLKTLILACRSKQPQHLVIHTLKKRYKITCLSHKADGSIVSSRRSWRVAYPMRPAPEFSPSSPISSNRSERGSRSTLNKDKIWKDFKSLSHSDKKQRMCGLPLSTAADRVSITLFIRCFSIQGAFTLWFLT